MSQHFARTVGSVPRLQQNPRAYIRFKTGLQTMLMSPLCTPRSTNLSVNRKTAPLRVTNRILHHEDVRGAVDAEIRAFLVSALIRLSGQLHASAALTPVATA
jgi:hypothetical protein